MKNRFSTFFSIACLLLLCLATMSCEKDDAFIDTQTQEISLGMQARVQVNTGRDVSKSAIDYIKLRTNNSFAVVHQKNSVVLSDNVLTSKTTNLGIVDASKEIVVINATNTKHTFKVITPVEENSITNLIIVEKADTTYEYFLKYTFIGEIPFNDDGGVDLSRFNGTIKTFNSSGELIGNIGVENGVVTNDEGQMAPCPDEDLPGTNDDTSNNDGSTTSGGDGSIPGTDGDATGTYDNTSNSSGGELVDVDGGCGLSWSYAQCGCGGTANGHPPQPDFSCCQGSPLVVRDCNGTIIAQRNANTATTMFKRTAFDPCNDGDVGVILTDEELCNLDNDSYNAYYTSKSPFAVDLNEVRNVCDSISTPENEKFMCIYNKLTKSPSFKNLFIDTFGESKDFNVKFIVEDNLTNNGNSVRGLAVRESYTINSDGTITDIKITIKINGNLFSGTEARTPMDIAKTIMHECIHAYLYVKIINCDQGSSLASINDSLFEDLIDLYFDNSTCVAPQDQHEFMTNYMLPTFTQIMSEIKDDMIPQDQQDYISDIDFYNISQLPSVNGPLLESTPFTWSNLYYYLSLSGLHNTDFYSTAIASDPVKIFLKNYYIAYLNQLSKNCSE